MATSVCIGKVAKWKIGYGEVKYLSFISSSHFLILKEIIIQNGTEVPFLIFFFLSEYDPNFVVFNASIWLQTNIGILLHT